MAKSCDGCTFRGCHHASHSLCDYCSDIGTPLSNGETLCNNCLISWLKDCIHTIKCEYCDSQVSYCVLYVNVCINCIISHAVAYSDDTCTWCESNDTYTVDTNLHLCIKCLKEYTAKVE